MSWHKTCRGLTQPAPAIHSAVTEHTSTAKRPGLASVQLVQVHPIWKLFAPTWMHQTKVVTITFKSQHKQRKESSSVSVKGVMCSSYWLRNSNASRIVNSNQWSTVSLSGDMNRTKTLNKEERLNKKPAFSYCRQEERKKTFVVNLRRE